MDLSELHEESFDRYMNEIAGTPVLSREEEKKLARKSRLGDEEARKKLIKANLRFVISAAKKYVNQGLSFNDLVGAGNLGLIKAVNRFDERRGFRLISYAVWWIRQSIQDTLAKNAKAFRLPMNRYGIVNKLSKISNEISQNLGREARLDEIAEEMGIPVEEVEEAENIARKQLSLDQNGTCFDNGDLEPLINSLPDDKSLLPSENLAIKERSSGLLQLLETLKEREKDIIIMYFGLKGDEPLTLEEIGRKMNLTRERIRQLKEKAIKRLRHPSRFNRIQDL